MAIPWGGTTIHCRRHSPSHGRTLVLDILTCVGPVDIHVDRASDLAIPATGDYGMITQLQAGEIDWQPWLYAFLGLMAAGKSENDMK